MCVCEGLLSDSDLDGWPAGRQKDSFSCYREMEITITGGRYSASTAVLQNYELCLTVACVYTNTKCGFVLWEEVGAIFFT